jgi:hypothetical protein
MKKIQYLYIYSFFLFQGRFVYSLSISINSQQPPESIKWRTLQSLYTVDKICRSLFLRKYWRDHASTRNFPTAVSIYRIFKNIS